MHKFNTWRHRIYNLYKHKLHAQLYLQQQKHNRIHTSSVFPEQFINIYIYIYVQSTNKKRTFLFHGMITINQIKIYLKYKGIELATNFFASISAISLLASFSTATCMEAQIKTKYNHRMHPYKVNIFNVMKFLLVPNLGPSPSKAKGLYVFQYHLYHSAQSDAWGSS